jgi:hypothetical protein
MKRFAPLDLCREAAKFFLALVEIFLGLRLILNSF